MGVLMSYKESYFEEISEGQWEDQFETIRVHNDTLKSGGTPALLSNSGSPDDVEHFKVPQTISIDIEDVNPDIPNPRDVSNGQTDIVSKRGFLLNVRYRGSPIIQYDPFREIFNISDIYHRLNSFTDEVIKACKELQENIVEYIEKADEKEEIAIVGGKPYKMEPISDGEFDGRDGLQKFMDEATDMVDEIIEQAKSEVSSGFSVSNRDEVNKLEKNNIYLTSIDNSYIYAYKRTSVNVKAIRGNGVNWPVELPEDLQNTIEGRIRLKLRNPNNINTELNHRVSGVKLDFPHHHRDMECMNGFQTLCTGHLSLSPVNNIDDLISRFEEVEEALKVINVDSIYSKDIERVGYGSWSEYKEVLKEAREDD